MIGSYFRRIINPEAYNGISNLRNYFEGWYFKLISADKSTVIAVIVGVSRGKTKEDAHCFIQLINSVSGKSHYIRFPYDAFHAMGTYLDIQIERNRFCAAGLHLDIHTDEIELCGKIDFDDIKQFPKTRIRRSIMGPFLFVPFMECYHGIVNTNQKLKGTLEINSQSISFNGGSGYIEKDSGTSFPSAWLWTQANNFKNENVTFMLSIADIPWLGRTFVGLLSFLHIDNQYYSIATYNGAKIRRFVYDDCIRITIENTIYRLQLVIKQFEGSMLKAPSKGIMEREITESVSSNVKIRFSNKKGDILFEGESMNAGLETAGNWQALFKEK